MKKCLIIDYWVLDIWEGNRVKILVLADSTAMWIRPYRNHIDDLTYIELLKKNGIELDVISTPGMTSKEVLDIYWNELGAQFYDIYVVSVGINDLTPRSYPRWMWKINNKLLFKETHFSRFYSFFYKLFTNHYVQKKCAQYKFSKPWINLKLFRAYLGKFQELVLKESDSKIIYLSLPQVSERVSSLLHSIDESIIAYKKEMNCLVDNNRVFQIDINDLFKVDRMKYNQEGIHYSAEGHRIVFDALYKKIIDIERKK